MSRVRKTPAVVSTTPAAKSEAAEPEEKVKSKIFTERQQLLMMYTRR